MKFNIQDWTWLGVNVFYRHCGEWERLHLTAGVLYTREHSSEKAQVSIQKAHLAEINHWQQQQLPKQGLQWWWWGKWNWVHLWPLQILAITRPCKETLSTPLWGHKLPSVVVFLPGPGENWWLVSRKSYQSSRSWVVKQCLTALHMPSLFHAYWLFASVSFLTASLGLHSRCSPFSSALFLSPPLPFSIFPFTSLYMCFISS